MTPLNVVYDSFFTLITDDMYMEIGPEDTRKDCKSLLLASLPLFEFPVAPINITTELVGPDKRPVDFFSRDLTLEEINILAYGMVEIWLQRQITSIEVVRQKFSGTDFKLTSQASHLTKLLTLIEDIRNEHRRLQMLCSRRRVNETTGNYESTFDLLVKKG